VAACVGTLVGSVIEESVHAVHAHRVVAFGVDEEFHVFVEVAYGFADGAHIVGGKGRQAAAAREAWGPGHRDGCGGIEDGDGGWLWLGSETSTLDGVVFPKAMGDFCE